MDKVLFSLNYFEHLCYNSGQNQCFFFELAVNSKVFTNKKFINKLTMFIPDKVENASAMVRLAAGSNSAVTAAAGSGTGTAAKDLARSEQKKKLLTITNSRSNKTLKKL